MLLPNGLVKSVQNLKNFKKIGSPNSILVQGLNLFMEGKKWQKQAEADE